MSSYAYTRFSLITLCLALSGQITAIAQDSEGTTSAEETSDQLGILLEQVRLKEAQAALAEAEQKKAEAELAKAKAGGSDGAVGGWERW